MSKKFELTAEEVEIVKHCLDFTFRYAVFIGANLDARQIKLMKLEKVRTRIKQWQDENNNIE